MQNICQLIAEICSKYRSAIIWITGDMNLPNINWNLNSVTGNSYLQYISNSLIDEFNSGGFIRMVELPTRGNNILDQFATNRPSMVQHIEVIPGISDHEIVSVESALLATIIKPKAHQVYLWNKANLQEINNKPIQFSNLFITENSCNTPIKKLWDSFKTNPSRMLKAGSMQVPFLLP